MRIIKIFGKIDINQIIENKALVSVFAGSRKSEINILMPILLDFIKLMNKKYSDFTFVFHSTKEYSQLIKSFVANTDLPNCEVVSDDKIKQHILQKSFFCCSKIWYNFLEISNARIPSIVLYKMGIINFLIVKSLVKTKYANIINFAANEEIIQNCQSKL